MTKVIFILISFWASTIVAQNFKFVSGPIYGHFTDSSQHFWLMAQPLNNTIYGNWNAIFNKEIYKYFEDSTGYQVKTILESKTINKGYVVVTGILRKEKITPTTKENLSFLVGSCAMKMPFPLLFLGKKRENIYSVMTTQHKDFMIWLGDNVYYWNGQWKTKKKMHRQNIIARTNPKIRSLLQSCPQYAIWDDHDYGPNNSGKSYYGKYNSLEIFKTYWANPSYGLEATAGVFSCFSQGDADFFMLDGRFYAEHGQSMLGKEQTLWLKEKLKASKANFKFIISGTQIISSPLSGEDMGDYGASRQDFYDFLSREKISGVIIISGDRHYAELVKMERENTYPLYEMTTSPLTSMINPSYPKDSEIRQKNTLALEPNFGKIHLLGTDSDRKCRLELYNAQGKILWTKDILLSELK